MASACGKRWNREPHGPPSCGSQALSGTAGDEGRAGDLNPVPRSPPRPGARVVGGRRVGPRAPRRANELHLSPLCGEFPFLLRELFVQLFCAHPSDEAAYEGHVHSLASVVPFVVEHENVVRRVGSDEPRHVDVVVRS